LTHNFAPANSEITTLKLKTLTTKLQLVSQPQNCELKQEPGLVWNCSEIATSGRIFVLTLNRASALIVSDNEIHFLLRQNIVATANSIGLESKLHHCRRIGLESKPHQPLSKQCLSESLTMA